MKIPHGKYRHYKGNLYEVLDTARHSETQEWHVVYKTLYGDFSTWIRPLEMFLESVEVNGEDTTSFCLFRPYERRGPVRKMNRSASGPVSVQ